MRTFSPTPGDIDRKWYVVDASGQVLGRLATGIAHRLRGKHKPEYAPHMDNGDFIVVVNVEKLAVTGNKLEDKRYYRHTGYPGNMKEWNLATAMLKKPQDVLIRAVRGMLPKNRLCRQMLKKLKIYVGPDHPHQAQQPAPLTFS